MRLTAHDGSFRTFRMRVKPVLGGDGQVTLGNIVVKGSARKVRKVSKAFKEFQAAVLRK